MGLNLFNFLIKKPIYYVSRQRHGMKKGTRIAEDVIRKVGPVLAQALLENSDLIARALLSAEERIAGELDRGLFDLKRADYALRAAIVSAGLHGEVREYVQEYASARLREKLPQAEDATRESLAAVFTAIRNQIDQIAWDYSHASVTEDATSPVTVSPTPTSPEGTNSNARP